MSERTFAPRGIAELATALHGLREELRKIDVQLQEAHDVAEEAEERWTQLSDEVLEQWEEKHPAEKLPGEDLRNSMVRRAGGAEAWANHRRADRMVKKLEKRATMVKDRIGAAQSESKLQGIV